MKQQILLLILVLISAGCASKNNMPLVPGGNAGDPIVSKTMEEFARAAAPQAGDRKNISYLDYYDLDANTYCDYLVNEYQEVKAVDAENITLNYTRNATLEPGNPANCPSQIPNFVSQKTYTETKAGFIQSQERWIRELIDPAQNMAANDWVLSARIVSSEHLKYMNGNAVKLVLEIKAKSNRTYTRTVYVSLDSIFLGTLGWERRNSENDHLVDFLRSTNFSVNNSTLNY